MYIQCGEGVMSLQMILHGFVLVFVPFTLKNAKRPWVTLRTSYERKEECFTIMHKLKQTKSMCTFNTTI